MIFFLKILLAAIIIAFASWLSGKKPELSGFIIALPIASIIAIAFSYLEHKNTENSVIFAKSILVGVPVSYLFFLPFLFAKSFNFNFDLNCIHNSHLLLWDRMIPPIDMTDSSDSVPGR